MATSTIGVRPTQYFYDGSGWHQHAFYMSRLMTAIEEDHSNASTEEEVIITEQQSIQVLVKNNKKKKNASERKEKKKTNTMKKKKKKEAMKQRLLSDRKPTLTACTTTCKKAKKSTKLCIKEEEEDLSITYRYCPPNLVGMCARQEDDTVTEEDQDQQQRVCSKTEALDSQKPPTLLFQGSLSIVRVRVYDTEDYTVPQASNSVDETDENELFLTYEFYGYTCNEEAEMKDVQETQSSTTANDRPSFTYRFYPTYMVGQCTREIPCAA
jgi:hypothetical protein